jgi:hypothetical protein
LLLPVRTVFKPGGLAGFLKAKKEWLRRMTETRWFFFKLIEGLAQKGFYDNYYNK